MATYTLRRQLSIESVSSTFAIYLDGDYLLSSKSEAQAQDVLRCLNSIQSKLDEANERIALLEEYKTRMESMDERFRHRDPLVEMPVLTSTEALMIHKNVENNFMLPVIIYHSDTDYLIPTVGYYWVSARSFWDTNPIKNECAQRLSDKNIRWCYIP